MKIREAFDGLLRTKVSQKVKHGPVQFAASQAGKSERRSAKS